MHIYSFNDLKFTLKHLNVLTCFDHTIILREHTLFIAKSYSLKTVSDLHRYVQLVLWQHVLCVV